MNKQIKRIRNLMALLAVVFLLWATLWAPSAYAAEYFKQAFGRFSAIAGATLATGDVVCISGSDGYAYKADANDSDKRPAIGVVRKGAASGSKVEIIFVGVLSGQTAASPGARLFLSETAGVITTTGPTNAQALGWVLPGAAAAATSTDYFISVNIATSSGAGY